MIDVAKDKMSSKRFMPSLIDIPEELSHYSGYGSNQGLSHYAEELRRSGSFNNRAPFTTIDEGDSLRNSYGTLKRPTKKYDSLQRNSLSRKATTSDNAATDAAAMLSENKDEIYHPMELRTNFLQKSPLPGRKSVGLSSNETTMNLVSIYTNPSIEEIYRSLDRSQPPRLSKRSTESGAESDAVSDLVSEAESKMPKITGPGMNRKTYFEPDSLDRKPAPNYAGSNHNNNHNNNSSRPHLYQKKPPRWTKRALHSDTNDEMREADENSSSAAGYTSSTCTSMKSLSRVLPAQEAMEVGNQLFNMDTGAPTLPRLIKPTITQPNRGANIYETIGRNQDGADGIFVNKEFRKPPPEVIYSSSNTSSSSSKITIVEDCLKNKLTIQVDDIRGTKEEETFEPDTLDRRNDSQSAPPFRRQESFIADSLERPIHPVKSTINKFINNAAGNGGAPVSPSSSSSGLGSSGESLANKEDWIKKEELPPPGSVVSLRQIYTARTHQPKPETWTTATLEATKKPPSRIVSASNTQILLRLAGNDESRIYGGHQSLPSEPISPPPLPIKAIASPFSAPAIPRDLKPATGVHQHPTKTMTKQPTPYSSRGVQTESIPPPTLPPKNGKGGSSGKADADTATSAKKSLGDDDSKIYSGHFIMSHPSPNGSIKLPNVLERIAQIEREESRTSGASKGMEIALSLKARMGHLEGSLKDHKKTLSIKKTWRKLLDKVEDSFSETESAGSTLRRPPSSAAKLLKKSLPPPPPSDDENETDDESQSSLGSDGTGRDRYSINDGMSVAVDQATDGIKLKSFYTFGEDGHKPSPVQPISTSTIKSNSSAVQSRRSGTNGSVGSNLGRKLRTNDSYDSGLYSSNYSTYIGDY